MVNLGIVLTDRDNQLLQLLSRCSAVHTDHVKRLYGDTSRYHIKRLEKLSSEGLVTRSRGYVRITVNGLRAIGTEDKLVRVRKYKQEHCAEIVNLYYELTEWDMEFGIEVKRKRKFDNGSLFDAVISPKSSLTEYVVYLLSKEPRPVTLGRIWNEIISLSGKGINRAVILCPSRDAYVAVSEKVARNDNVKEVLLLPYPDGLKILNKHGSNDFRNLLADSLPGIEPATEGKIFVDYNWQGRDMVMLATNDNMRRINLTNYFNGQAHEAENRKITIICIKDQLHSFRNLYPKASIAVLSNNLESFLGIVEGGGNHE